MNKITLGLYRILSIAVILSMSLGMVGPASALDTQSASQASIANDVSQTPYDPFLSVNPYAAMLQDAPLSEPSPADLADMDTASLLAMPSVPLPFTPQDANNPMGLLGKLDESAVGTIDPSKRIMNQAQEQSQKAERSFSLGAWWKGLFNLHVFHVTK